MKKMNQIQKQWTWTITGQYLRALAGMRFPRTGASECDLMHNLVPELASADSKVFWSNGCFTNMLDHGAEYMKLCQLDMPRNFFSGTNCVAESGQFPSNFLLGVSTLGNDIQFRRQMRSREGEPITVAGNPPVQFASAKFDKENESQVLPSFPLFLARVFLNDLFSIGFLPMAGMLVYIILYTSFLRLDGYLIVSAFFALIFAEAIIVLLCCAIKKLLVGSEWGIEHSTPFWSWRHFSYFFAQDYPHWAMIFSSGAKCGRGKVNPSLSLEIRQYSLPAQSSIKRMNLRYFRASLFFWLASFSMIFSA